MTTNEMVGPAVTIGKDRLDWCLRRVNRGDGMTCTLTVLDDNSEPRAIVMSWRQWQQVVGTARRSGLDIELDSLGKADLSEGAP